MKGLDVSAVGGYLWFGDFYKSTETSRIRSQERLDRTKINFYAY